MVRRIRLLCKRIYKQRKTNLNAAHTQWRSEAGLAKVNHLCGACLLADRRESAAYGSFQVIFSPIMPTKKPKTAPIEVK